MIGTVLIPGASAPKLVTTKMVASMHSGGVVIDIAIDQGGCFEATDHISTHDDPTYTTHGIIHYAVANTPGAVTRTSTIALSNATLSYAKRHAKQGYRQASPTDSALIRG